MRYLALPLTADARAAHPHGVPGKYACVANMIRYGLRHAHPGPYAIRVKGTDRPIATAYVRAASVMEDPEHGLILTTQAIMD